MSTCGLPWNDVSCHTAIWVLRRNIPIWLTIVVFSEIEDEIVVQEATCSRRQSQTGRHIANTLRIKSKNKILYLFLLLYYFAFADTQILIKETWSDCTKPPSNLSKTLLLDLKGRKSLSKSCR